MNQKTVIAKNPSSSHSAVSKHANGKLSGRKMVNQQQKQLQLGLHNTLQTYCHSNISLCNIKHNWVE